MVIADLTFVYLFLSNEMTTNRKPWSKNLYGNAGYADNYTDPSFLKDLQKNINVKPFTFMEAFNGAARLNQQITCVIGFLIIFYLMFENKIKPENVMLYSSSITILGYVFYMRNSFSFNAIREDGKTVLSVLVFGYLFSPLLHTLTDSISTDTIYTTTFFVMFIHLVFFDYGISAVIVSKAISLNAAIFGAICLASRLSSSFHAFVLLVTSTEFFALCPILLNKYSSPLWLIPISTVCIVFFYQMSLSLLITYSLILVFINLVCPYVFVNQQKYKNNIHGPWDEAIVKDLVIDN